MRDFSKNLSNFMSLGANAIGPLLAGATGISFSFIGQFDSTGTSDDCFNFYCGNGASILVWLPRSGAGSLYAARVTGDGYSYPLGSCGYNTTGAVAQHGFVVDWSTGTRSLAYYRDGTLITSTTLSVAGGSYSHTSATNLDTLGCIANTSAPLSTNRQIDGKFGEFCVWKKALSAGDFVALGGRCSPRRVQPSAIIGYWKLNGQGSPEIEIFNGKAGAINGSMPVMDHPRMFN